MKKLIRYTSRKGFTILEVFIASGMFLIILVVAYTVWSQVTANYFKMEAKIEARQQVRQVGDRLSRDIKNASYAFVNRTVIIEGIEFEIADIETEGKNIILAIPENSDIGYITYTVVGYYLVQNTNDELNDQTYDLYRYEKNNVSPETADTPVTIDLPSLTGGSKRKVAGFIDRDRFKFIIKDSGNTIEVKPLVTKREWSRHEPEVVEVFITQNLRNK